MWLQNFDIFDQLAHVDPESGEVSMKSRSALANKVPTHTNGFFQTWAGVLVSIYSYRGKLFFMLGNNQIELDDDHTSEAKEKDGAVNFKIFVGGNILISLERNIDQPPHFPNDTTPFVDRSSFNFLIFASEVINNKQKKAIFVEVNG